MIPFEEIVKPYEPSKQELIEVWCGTSVTPNKKNNSARLEEEVSKIRKDMNKLKQSDKTLMLIVQGLGFVLFMGFLGFILGRFV